MPKITNPHSGTEKLYMLSKHYENLSNTGWVEINVTVRKIQEDYKPKIIKA